MRKSKWLCFFLAVLLLISAVPVHGTEQMVATENKKPLVEKINKALTRIQITEGDNQDQTEWKFIYNLFGELDSALEYDREGNILNGFQYQFNEQGFCVGYTNYQNSELITRKILEYNEKGFLISEKKYCQTEFGWDSEEVLIQYDENENYIGEIINFNGSISEYKFEYTNYGYSEAYYENEKLTSLIKYDHNGNILYDYSAKYASDGNLISEIIGEYIENCYSETLYEKGQEGKLLSRICYDNDGVCLSEYNAEYRDGKLVYETNNEYNNGLCIHKAYHSFIDSNREHWSDTYYEYNDADLLVQKTVKGTGFPYDYTEIYYYSYNDAGQLVSVSEQRNQNEEPVIIEYYEYHENGQLKKEYERPGLDLKPIREYDEHGRTIMDTYVDGNAAGIYRYTYHYFYDDIGQLCKTVTDINVTNSFSGNSSTSTWEEAYSYYGMLTITEKEKIEPSPNDSPKEVFVEYHEPLSEFEWIFWHSLIDCEQTIDADGNLIKVTGTLNGESVTIEFFYEYVATLMDSDAVPQPMEMMEGKPYAKLQYPLSENDGYVLYKNFFGEDMDASDRQVIISNSGEGEATCITYTVYAVEDTALAAPLEAFQVYINTGICETLESNGTRRRFRAEDYFVLPLGQVNDDGQINYADALFALRASINLETITGYQSASADVNRDGTVNYVDALMILRYSIGLIESFS